MEDKGWSGEFCWQLVQGHTQTPTLSKTCALLPATSKAVLLPVVIENCSAVSSELGAVRKLNKTVFPLGIYRRDSNPRNLRAVCGADPRVPADPNRWLWSQTSGLGCRRWRLILSPLLMLCLSWPSQTPHTRTQGWRSVISFSLQDFLLDAYFTLIPPECQSPQRDFLQPNAEDLEGRLVPFSIPRFPDGWCWK